MQVKSFLAIKIDLSFRQFYNSQAILIAKGSSMAFNAFRMSIVPCGSSNL